MLTIGEFARETGLTAKALRLYDDLGLLAPADVDDRTGYRRYTPDQVDRARLVARLRSAGVPLRRIATIVELDSREAAAAELLSYWRQVEADTASARDVVAALVSQMRGHDTTMDTSNDTTEAGTSARSAHRAGQGARPAQLDEVYPHVHRWATQIRGSGCSRSPTASVPATTRASRRPRSTCSPISTTPNRHPTRSTPSTRQ